MRHRLIATCLLVFLVHCFTAVAQAVKPPQRDKILEALTDVDMVRGAHDQFEYTLSYLQAKRSINTAWRAALSPAEKKAVTAVALEFEHLETARIQGAAGDLRGSRDSKEKAEKDRSSAISVLGMTDESVYPHEIP